MTDHLTLLRIAAATAYDMADRMEPGTRVRAVAHAYASGIRHAETIHQDAHDADDPEAAELRDGWHLLAHHPAIRPPHWEPGNGQTYLEAVLEHLDARDAATPAAIPPAAMEAALQAAWPIIAHALNAQAEKGHP